MEDHELAEMQTVNEEKDHKLAVAKAKCVWKDKQLLHKTSLHYPTFLVTIVKI